MNLGLNKTRSQALVILLVGAGLGLAANAISPRGLPLIAVPKPAAALEEYLPLERAKALWYDGRTLFLDAREPEDYAAGHIGNALNLPAQSFAQHFGEIAPMLTPASVLVLYCDGNECDLSHRLRESLRPLGYTNTHLLFNGWTAWRQAGLPTTMADKQ
jgi:rhodanese-related sulfurtransferase